jgi:hypothetical protein
MKTQFHSGYAERAGILLGRAWGRILHAEHCIVGWLRRRGLSAATATTVLWILNVAFLAATFYFWATLVFLIIGALLVVVVAPHVDLSEKEEKPRWRHGAAGYGLYRGERRLDGWDMDGQG